jgi:cell fate (sporulation/competence/biofilm development) regulator YlbF (YheA/YmcA/DUF963 family)
MNANTLSPDLVAATHALADVLMQAEPLAAFHHAWQTLNDDTTATGLLDALTAAQADMRRSQMNGDATQAGVDHMRDLQRQVQTNALIMTYVRAQRDAAAYLPGVNMDISDLLGIDFAAFSNAATC